MQQRIEAIANVEMLEKKPIFTGHLHTDGDIDMNAEIWVEIVPEDRTDDMRVSSFLPDQQNPDIG